MDSFHIHINMSIKQQEMNLPRFEVIYRVKLLDSSLMFSLIRMDMCLAYRRQDMIC